MSPEKKASIIMAITVLSIVVAIVCEQFLNFLLLAFTFNVSLCLFALIWGAIAVGLGSRVVDDPVDSLEIVFKAFYVKPFKFIKAILRKTTFR